MEVFQDLCGFPHMFRIQDPNSVRLRRTAKATRLRSLKLYKLNKHNKAALPGPRKRVMTASSSNLRAYEDVGRLKCENVCANSFASRLAHPRDSSICRFPTARARLLPSRCPFFLLPRCRVPSEPCLHIMFPTSSRTVSASPLLSATVPGYRVALRLQRGLSCPGLPQASGLGFPQQN